MPRVAAPKELRKPVDVPPELIQHQRNYHGIAHRRKARLLKYWNERVCQISDTWEHTSRDCTCWANDDSPHKKVRFKRGNKWFIVCPISYWFILKRYSALYDNTDILGELMQWPKSKSKVSS